MSVNISIDKKTATVTTVVDITEQVAQLEAGLSGGASDSDAKKNFTRAVIDAAFNELSLASAGRSDAERSSEIAKIEAQHVVEKAKTPEIDADVDDAITDAKAVVAAKG